MHSYSRSQETGAIRLLQPLSRAKEERMRVARFLILLVSFSVAAFAADLKVKVVAPQGVAVAGAQVSLVQRDDGKILASQVSSAEGFAVLGVPSPGAVRVQVLAPGFAAETVEVSSQSE